MQRFLFFVLSFLIASAAAPCVAATVYTYDDLGRIVTATYDDGQEIVYTYDAAGNRTQIIVQPASP